MIAGSDAVAPLSRGTTKLCARSGNCCKKAGCRRNQVATSCAPSFSVIPSIPSSQPFPFKHKCGRAGHAHRIGLCIGTDLQTSTRQLRPLAHRAAHVHAGPAPPPPHTRHCAGRGFTHAALRTRASESGWAKAPAQTRYWPTVEIAALACNSGPIRSTSALATSSTSITACGLPIDTAPGCNIGAKVQRVEGCLLRTRSAESPQAQTAPGPCRSTNPPWPSCSTVCLPAGLSIMSCPVPGLRHHAPTTLPRSARQNAALARDRAVGIPDAIVGDDIGMGCGFDSQNFDRNHTDMPVRRKTAHNAADGAAEPLRKSSTTKSLPAPCILLNRMAAALTLARCAHPIAVPLGVCRC